MGCRYFKMNNRYQLQEDDLFEKDMSITFEQIKSFDEEKVKSLSSLRITRKILV